MKSSDEKRLQDRYSTKYYSKGEGLTRDGLEAVSFYKKKIDFTSHINYTVYLPRDKQRYELIGDNFGTYFGDSILDVGSRNNMLSEKIGKPCTLVDKNNPDLPPFDWEKERLPYGDSSFDTVVCLDTLEHVDNLHDNVKDLLRVSKKHIIISLPNNWKKTLNEFIKGTGRWPHYGIPPVKPVDRHKWFFNAEDIEDLFYYNATGGLGSKYGIKEVVYHIPKTIMRIKILYPILKFLLPERHFKNFFVETVFIVLEKK